MRQRRPLDARSAEGLMLGDGDVPSGFERVAEALDALRSTRVVGVVDRRPVPAERALIPVPAAASTVAPPAPSRRRRPASHLLLGSILVMVPLVAGLIGAGALPDGAQRFASDVLDEVGISVPSPDDDKGTGVGAGLEQKNEDAIESTARTGTGASVRDLCVAYLQGQQLAHADFRRVVAPARASAGPRAPDPPAAAAVRSFCTDLQEGRQ